MGKLLSGILLGVFFTCVPYFGLRYLLNEAEDQIAQLRQDLFERSTTARSKDEEKVTLSVTASYLDENGRTWQCIFEDIENQDKNIPKNNKRIKYGLIVPGRYDSIRGEVSKTKVTEMLTECLYNPSVMTNFHREVRQPLDLSKIIKR
jgi:hypothetical protein